MVKERKWNTKLIPVSVYPDETIVVNDNKVAKAIPTLTTKNYAFTSKAVIKKQRRVQSNLQIAKAAITKELGSEVYVSKARKKRIGALANFKWDFR